MKRIVLIILIISTIITLNGCGNRNDSYNGSQIGSNKTIVVLQETEEFDVYSVHMNTVDSSCFCEVGYDYNCNVLVVRFVENNKPLYAYLDVPESIYEQMMKADSLGNFYNNNIKGKYDCTKY